MHRSINRIVLPAAAAAAAALALAVAGCESSGKDDWSSSSAQKMDTDGKAAAVANLKTAPAASTQPKWGKPTGTVTFTQAGDDKVKVAYDLKGLTPGTHGFHIHEKGDLSAADFSSAGPHFNPTKHKHAGPETKERHAGDLGNVEADTSGNAKGTVTAEGLSIGSGAANDIIGRSIVVHEKADDLKSDPSGNSGARVAAGVIEAKK
jgi:superoxide dismutase, Cu-Zn family